MDKSEIKVKVKELLYDQACFSDAQAQFVKGGSDDVLSKPLQDLHFDSLDMVVICMDVEDEFGIEVPDEDAESWRTAQDIIDCVAKYKT